MRLAAIFGISLLVACLDLLRRQIHGNGVRRFWPLRNVESLPSIPSTVDRPVSNVAKTKPLPDERPGLGTTKIRTRLSEIPAAQLPLAGFVRVPRPSPKAPPFGIRMR